MKFLLALVLVAMPTGGLSAQSIPAPGEINAATPTSPPPPAADDNPPPESAPSTSAPHGAAAPSAIAMEHLVRSNQELLDLLKKQQAVLEDIQYDRRLQNRQITLLEQRLEDTLQLNAALQAKVASLEATAATSRNAPPTRDQAPSVPTQSTPLASGTGPQPPVPPASALPPGQTGGAPGTMWWHRLVSLSGTDSQNSDNFHIAGRQWRVLWHNQDRPGDAYKNTSALFISAFPKNDTLPKKVCSQLGTGGDATELTGSGDYYLKIEASGGNWELAVEDFH